MKRTSKTKEMVKYISTIIQAPHEQGYLTGVVQLSSNKEEEQRGEGAVCVRLRKI